jgi:hypothetical protein
MGGFEGAMAALAGHKVKQTPPIPDPATLKRDA